MRLNDPEAGGTGTRAGVALVTGASSGIGAAFATRLAHDGFDVLAVARRGDRLRALTQRLGADYGAAVEPVVADLAQSEDLRMLEARIAGDPRLALLVNNAGFTHATRFARLEPDAIEAMIRVHVVALVRLTRAALPGMLARGAGAVINVSSMLGFWPVPLGAGLTYAATKAFVTAFSRGLDREVARRGVRVQTLCPGWTRTELLERAGRPWDIPEAATMTPEAVVEASLAGLRLGEAVCLPSVHDPALLDHLDALATDLLAAAGSTGTTAPRYLG